ncbi:MAG: GNAT family N-acetyltransferase [Synechococcales cyanobacterium T60_A2020_003]|nr:GNAT family N-acetyltransferase [Synechococcales cyanobacterium T60_A2020_003]
MLHATVEKLQHSLFGETPFARVLLVEQSDQGVGVPLYYFRYSSFQARPGLWLDDLYLIPAVRHQGMGTALMIHLVRIVQQVNCTHIAWTASVNNASGIRFYEKIGGTVLEQRQDLFYFQLDEASMRSLVHQGAIAAA